LELMAAGVGFAPTSRASRARPLLEQPANGSAPSCRPRFSCFRGRRLSWWTSAPEWCPVKESNPRRPLTRRLHGPRADRAIGVTGGTCIHFNHLHRMAPRLLRLRPHSYRLTPASGVAGRIWTDMFLLCRQVPRYSATATELAPAEQNRTLLRGFGVRVVHQNTPVSPLGIIGWQPRDRTELIPP
jgi:hypothetical protein